MATPKKNKSSRVTIPIRAYPVLPLRDIVVFPFMIVPLFVGRSKSIAALENAVQDDGMVFLMAQKNTSDENPDPADLYEVGTVAKVLQMLKLPDGTVGIFYQTNGVVFRFNGMNLRIGPAHHFNGFYIFTNKISTDFHAMAGKINDGAATRFFFVPKPIAVWPRVRFSRFCPQHSSNTACLHAGYRF
jgi:hypothetical protein